MHESHLTAASHLDDRFVLPVADADTNADADADKAGAKAETAEAAEASPPILLLLTPIHDTSNRRPRRKDDVDGWTALLAAWARLCVRICARRQNRRRSDDDDDDDDDAVVLGGVIVVVDATKGVEEAAATARDSLSAAFVEAEKNATRAGRKKAMTAVGGEAASDINVARFRVEVSRRTPHECRCRKYALVTLTVTLA